MNKKQIQHVLKYKWKSNPFAMAWKRKNDIIAYNRMWKRIIIAINK